MTWHIEDLDIEAIVLQNHVGVIFGAVVCAPIFSLFFAAAYTPKP